MFCCGDAAARDAMVVELFGGPEGVEVTEVPEPAANGGSEP